MKKYRMQEKFLEEIAKTPIIQVVCNNLNLSRQTISRWKKEDEEFKRKLDEALKIGDETTNDFLFSKALSIAQGGCWPAVKTLLKSMHPKFKEEKHCHICNPNLANSTKYTLTDLLLEKLERARFRKKTKEEGLDNG